MQGLSPERGAKPLIELLVTNIAPIACALGATFALILSAFHLCPYSVTLELFRFLTFAGAANGLLKSSRNWWIRDRRWP
jgi:hypothetical protein